MRPRYRHRVPGPCIADRLREAAERLAAYGYHWAGRFRGDPRRPGSPRVSASEGAPIIHEVFVVSRPLVRASMAKAVQPQPVALLVASPTRRPPPQLGFSSVAPLGLPQVLSGSQIPPASPCNPGLGGRGSPQRPVVVASMSGMTLQRRPSAGPRRPLPEESPLGPSLTVQSVRLRRSVERHGNAQHLEEDFGAMTVGKLGANPSYRLDLSQSSVARRGPQGGQPQQNGMGFIPASATTAHDVLRLQHMDARVQSMVGKSFDVSMLGRGQVGKTEQLDAAQISLAEAIRAKEYQQLAALHGPRIARGPPGTLAWEQPSNRSFPGGPSLSGVISLGRRLTRGPASVAAARRSVQTTRDPPHLSVRAPVPGCDSRGDIRGDNGISALNRLLGQPPGNARVSKARQDIASMAVTSQGHHHQEQQQQQPDKNQMVLPEALTNTRQNNRRCLPVRPASGHPSTRCASAGDACDATSRLISQHHSSSAARLPKCNAAGAEQDQGGGAAGCAAPAAGAPTLDLGVAVGASAREAAEAEARVGNSDASAANTDEASGHTTPESHKGPDSSCLESGVVAHRAGEEGEGGGEEDGLRRGQAAEQHSPCRNDAGTTSPVGAAPAPPASGWATSLLGTSSACDCKGCNVPVSMV